MKMSKHGRRYAIVLVSIIFFAFFAWKGNLSSRNHSSYSNSTEDAHRDSKTMYTTENKQPWSIFFLRTSTENLECFELCALYSAAIHNPDTSVILYSSRVFELPEYIAGLKNVESKILNFDKVFENTPMQQWYQSNIWNVSNYIKRVRFLSDAARLAYLYKHGGAYLDTDFVSFKSLKNFSNAVAYQNMRNELANGFLIFQSNHPFLLMVMEIEAASFNPDRRDIYFGPKLMTRTAAAYDNNSKRGWPKLNKVQRELILPFDYNNAEALLEKASPGGRWDEQLKGAYLVHLWRNKLRSKLAHASAALDNTILYEVVNSQCRPLLHSWKTSGKC